MRVTPWWDALELRDEVVDAEGSIEDVQMSLFRAVHAGGDDRPLYADASYYGEITHPSEQFAALMSKVAVRLGAGSDHSRARALWRLDQAMGGGKSHGLIGLYHLAAAPAALAQTDIGKAAFKQAASTVGRGLPADLNNPRVVVVASDNMTAGIGSDLDGPARSLHERFLWRLFAGDADQYPRWEEYRPHFADKGKIGEALAAVGRPVLILVDEIMDYVRQLSATALHDLAIQDMAFLRALLDTVNDVPNVVMVLVMISSDRDRMDLDEAGQRRRAELEDLLIRNALPATINENADFGAILRRRLFATVKADEAAAQTASWFASHHTGAWKTKVLDAHPHHDPSTWEAEVVRCYPFHPHLIALAEREWANIAGFQRVRSTIRIFAATAHEQMRRGRAGDWTPTLIGPGDLPLSSTNVREAIIGSGLIVDAKAEANYRSVATTDIVGPDDHTGAARQMDAQRLGPPFDANPRAVERAATALFLASIVGHRPGGKQGATLVELKAAMLVPSAAFALADADVVLAEIADDESGLAAVEPITGKGGQAPRLYLTTRKTLTMLVRATRATITDEERDEALRDITDHLTKSGPFDATHHVRCPPGDKRPLRTVLAEAGLDDARSTRLVVLDAARFSLLNGVDQDTRAAVDAALGLGDQKLPQVWASSVVFAAVNTQRRAQARTMASHWLAWRRVSEMDAVKADESTSEQAKDELSQARRDLQRAVRLAYQHVLFLAEGQGSASRFVDRVGFDLENQTALDGQIVWKALATRGKTFEVGSFSAKALLSNLREDDFGRPLDELRNLFWQTPRLPLLPGGEADLRSAIQEAVNAGEVDIIGADGQARSVMSVSLNQSGLTLQKKSQAPAAPPEPPKPGDEKPPPHEAAVDHEVSFAVTANIDNDQRRDALYKLIEALSIAVDEGKVSHLQMTVKVVVPEAAAAVFTTAASTAGAHHLDKPLPG